MAYKFIRCLPLQGAMLNSVCTGKTRGLPISYERQLKSQSHSKGFILLSFIEGNKYTYAITVLSMCVCVSLLQLSNQVTSFHEMWYDL